MSGEGDPSIRGAHPQLLAWAQKAYADGASVHDLMRKVYGVDLPKEAYIFYRLRPRDPELPIDLVFFPWELIELTSSDYEHRTADPWSEEQERCALAQFPDFLPLLKLGGTDRVKYNSHVIGYSISKLRQGSTLIQGHKEDIPPTNAHLTTMGDSLLSVMHEWMSDYLQKTTDQYNSPSNRGFGSLSDDDVDYAKTLLKSISKMQRRLLAEQSA